MSIRTAPVFDGYTLGSGPYFAPDRGRIDDLEQRRRLAAYLRSGTIVLRSFALDPDVVEPGRGAVVPGSFRTDGSWLWSDALLYYVETHGVAPPADLAEHIAAAGYRCPQPDAEAVRAAAQVLHDARTGEVSR
jgi:hypothetical protein